MFWHRNDEYSINRNKIFKEVFLDHFNPTKSAIDESSNYSHQQYELTDTKNLFTYIKKRGNATKIWLKFSHDYLKRFNFTQNESMLNFYRLMQIAGKINFQRSHVLSPGLKESKEGAQSDILLSSHEKLHRA